MDIFPFGPDFGIFQDETEEPTPFPVADEGPIGEHWSNDESSEKNVDWTQYTTISEFETQLSLLTPAERALLNEQLDELIPLKCE